MTRIAMMIAACVAGAVAWPARAAPLEVYGRLPLIEQVAISPDGAKLAVIVTDGENRKIIIEQTSDGKIVSGVNAGAVKVRWLQWAGPNHVLITSSTTQLVTDLIGPRDEYYMTVDFDLTTNKMHQILNSVQGATNQTLNAIEGTPAIRLIDGHPFAFVAGVQFISGVGRLSLFKVDLDRNRASIVEDGFENTNQWVVSRDGQALAESEFEPRSLRWTLRVRERRGWRTVKVAQGSLGHPGLAGLGRDGRSALIASAAGDKDTLSELAADASDWGEPLAASENQQPFFDTASESLIGTSTSHVDDVDYQFFNPTDQAIWRAVAHAYPDALLTLKSLSADHRKVVVRVDSPVDGPAYALVDVDTHKGSWIGDEYSGLRAADISEVKPIAFKAADGLPLTGYFTTPRGREPRMLPLVVFPHGGPAARDTLGFDWWAQAMAAQGYAVLQVNFRGSEGFGRKHLEAGYGEWGRKMQTDLSDGVRHLAAQGVIDPKRVCIVGASYGGYAALAGATLDPGVYRCAASVSGVADPGRLIAWSRTQNGLSALKYWSRLMGVDGAHDRDLAAISPVAHAAAASGPILLVHGQDDTVVPYEQSRFMAEALKSAGKPVEFVTLKAEDHWMSRGETRLQMLQAVIAFLEKNNPPT
jgi:dipeptidyl aminopeptidase/acylaminoacyl peptidase